MTKQVVVITGASSGIGKALAVSLADAGAKVYGTTRNPATGEIHNRRSSDALTMIQLDVCCEDSVAHAVAQVMEAEGRIDVLINNAGNGICGAIEDTTVAEAHYQFDANFFGVLRMCRAVLPIMRAQKDGLIINIGSVAGHVAVPYQSMYSASKFALEAFTECLRIEAKPFGIRAAVVDPGDTKTGFTDNRKWVTAAAGSSYESSARKAIDTMVKSELNAPDPGAIVKAVKRIIRKKNPPVRIVVGLDYKLVVILKRLLPAKLFEFAITKFY